MTCAEPPPSANGSALGAWIVELLADVCVGQTVVLPRPIAIAGRAFGSFVVERDFRTASKARLLRMLPGDALYISKMGDVRHEHAMMCTLRHMNQRWRQCRTAVCGTTIEAVTYAIFPLGAEAGLVEVVPQSATLRELAQGISHDKRHLRVLHALGRNPAHLNKLAATTVAYLTSGYVLGIRDGHDDNIMLRADGALFRVDFGFVFGATPEIDTPQTVVPRAVSYALGDQRWRAVVAACRCALEALTGSAVGDPPAWDCLSGVAELSSYRQQAWEHTTSLSLEAFCRDVETADRWSLARATKNALREAVRYWTDVEGPSDGVGGGTGALPTGGARDVLYLASDSAKASQPQFGAGSSSPTYFGQGAFPPARACSDAWGGGGGVTHVAMGPLPLPPGDPFAPTPPGSPKGQGQGGEATAEEAAALAEAGATGSSWLQAWPFPLPPGDPFAPSPPGSPRAADPVVLIGSPAARDAEGSPSVAALPTDSLLDAGLLDAAG